MINTHLEIINAWPTTKTLSEDISVSHSLVRMWKTRGKIPSDHWPALISAAVERDIPLSYKMLAETAPVAN